MLLRSSISSTKKFFQKTLHNVKSLFSGGYHRLPKTPPHRHNSSFSHSAGGRVLDMNNNFSSYKDDLEKLDQFYTDFTEQWSSQQDKANAKGRNNKAAIFSSHMKKVQQISLPDVNSTVQPRGEYSSDQHKMLRLNQQVESSYGSKGTWREQKNRALAEKLKELEMLDKGSVDYVLDIEEVLHYYSRITSPAYLEILDKFFMDMYSELFAHRRGPSPSGITNSMPSLRSVKS